MHQKRSSTNAAEEQFASLAFQAMGCWFELAIDSTNQAIAEEMRDLVLDWHQRLSIFEPHSIVSMINRAPGSIELPIDSEMFALLKLCDQLLLQTHGAFNITTNQSEAFTLENHTITKSNDNTTLDFGAIAKGFVLDLIRIELEAYGIERAFIHGGTSSVLAMGSKPWKIQVGKHPVELCNQAVGISGLHSQSTPHILDPFTNKPVDNSIEQIVCIHQSAAIADAYATACCVQPTLIDELSAEQCKLYIGTIHDRP